MFNYKWNLSDGYPAKGITPSQLKVFGTFICGGGSSMGYKLAGYQHLGGVEIDAKIAAVYQNNHKPKYLFNEDIRAFNQRNDLPEDLYNLDILDGSPPCSTFSMAGSREKAWGKEKKFREGQQNQTLDDLVFTFIETIDKLKPKVCLLENVKGIISGNAKLYSKQIVINLKKIGYDVQVFLLNGATMGLPQARERVFFIGRKKELSWPELKLEFDEPAIPFKDIEHSGFENKVSPGLLKIYDLVQPGRSFATVHPKGNYFTTVKTHPNKVLNTIASGSNLVHYNEKRLLSNVELCLAGSYPLDYSFGGQDPQYLIGMSVPPLMIAQIANQIRKQWFKQ